MLDKHDLLAALHERLQPRTYFEIGVRRGKSLSLSRTTSVAVDPFYIIEDEVHCDLHLVRTSSDEFFARRKPLAHFPRPTIDLAFIDGMHLSEYALRDFINTERYCHSASVIVIDDMLPRTVEEAGRGRTGKALHGAWAGDVFKMIPVLRQARPDLVLLEVDTAPTGTLVVLLPDREDRSLSAAYDAAMDDLVAPDPQVVPDWAMQRTRSISAEALLDAPVWDRLRELRESRPHPDRSKVARLYADGGLATAKDAS